MRAITDFIALFFSLFADERYIDGIIFFSSFHWQLYT